MQEASDWVIGETVLADFGDVRLNKRYGNILSSLSAKPNSSIPGACKGWNETIAAYRFFNHENVTAHGILQPHFASTLARIQNEEVVLIPQDTTEIDFTGRKKIDGMGYLSSENTQGFYLHASIALTPERLCLGVTDIQSLTRNELGQRKKKRAKPIEAKESYCWIKGYEAANKIALASPNTIIISISDREGDIYEQIQKMPSEENKAYFLIRSSYDRCTLNEDGTHAKLLRERVRTAIPAGEIEFGLPAGTFQFNKKRSSRQERTVRQEVRACTILLSPAKRKGGKLEPVLINVVHCKEINPPGELDCIEWFLLTSFPVNNEPEVAMKIVDWYLCRWQIEVFFKTLKSGCKIEELQFETFDATLNCIALYSISAWRILYLTLLGRTCPEIPCSNVFNDCEWKAVYMISTKKPPPKIPPTLNAIIMMIAKFGGFLGRKSDGYPGIKVMWIGMQRMRDFAIAWEVCHSPGEESYV